MDLESNARHRYDGHWEFLATAAGLDASISKTISGLSAEELDKGAFGLAYAPSIIRERIDALAAWNMSLLSDVVEQWIPPKSIQGNWWWASAWNASLRYLKQLGTIRREDVEVPELAHEVDILYKSNDKMLSWGNMAQEIRSREVQGGFLYDDIRKLACYKLREESLSADDIINSPTIALRLLRGQANRLDDSARTALAEMALLWSSLPTHEASLIIELCKELELPISTIVSQQVASYLLQTHNPLDINYLVYTLLGRWCMP